MLVHPGTGNRGDSCRKGDSNIRKHESIAAGSLPWDGSEGYMDNYHLHEMDR
ncbi:hypothetical protein [Pasteuria penetrans]|uniref:hypothetical protein n=1 Tax=Pasteuria penetrans TaxID=86005 RepID=UPI001CAA7509|nr:hypothetical protein [Pasteuria penetrans]